MGNINILDISGNSFKSIDISNASDMERLRCSESNLDLFINGSCNVNTLICNNNNLTSLDLSKNKTLKFLYCMNNKLETLMVDSCVNLSEISCYNNLLKEFNIPSNTSILKINNNQLEKINVNSKYFFEFNCAKNKLTEITFLPNTQIRLLFLDSNKLSKIDLSKVDGLNEINISNNELTEFKLKSETLLRLYLSKNKIKNIKMEDLPNLVELNLAYNEIDSLYLNEHSKLISVAVNNNKIRNLNVGKSLKLTYFSCYNNDFVAHSMLNLIHSMPVATEEGKNSVFIPINTKSPIEKNICYTIYVDRAKKKLWRLYDCNSAENDENMKIPYLGSDPGTDGVEEADNFIRIYPNPTKDFIKIIKNEGQINSIKIYDIAGKTVYSSDINNDFINVQDLNNGSYTIELNIDNKVYHKKFIKN